MLIAGKSLLEESQIRNRFELGFENMEIAIPTESLAVPEYAIALLRRYPSNFVSFHTAHRTPDGDETGLGMRSKSKRRRVLEVMKRSMELAHEAQPGTQLVIHVGEALTPESNTPGAPGDTHREFFLEEIAELRDHARENCPGLTLTLEHCTPLAVFDGYLHYREWGIDWTYMNLVRNAGFNDIVKATLDFPHASYYAEFARRWGMERGFQDFFDAFGDDLSLIHLANPNGAKREFISTIARHSWGFRDDSAEDLETLREISGLLLRNRYDGPVIIEIQLEDYGDAAEVLRNAELFERVYSESKSQENSPSTPKR